MEAGCVYRLDPNMSQRFRPNCPANSRSELERPAIHADWLKGAFWIGIGGAPVPACALVPAAWTVEDVWRAIEGGLEPAAPEIADPGHAILVWRRGVTVHHRAVGSLERRALESLLPGTTFGALCTALGDELDSAEKAAQLAAECLGRWLADDLLARL